MSVKLKNFILIFSPLLIIFICCKYNNSNKIYDREYKTIKNDKDFLDTLQHRTFQYFVEETNPKNALVKDRSTEDSPSSIAAEGFAFPTWAIGAEHGWISRDKAINLTLTALKFFWNSKQSSDVLATGYKGLYYHFLDMETGKRFRDCELSTIDTGLLFAGILFARQYYDKNNSKENEIRDLAVKIVTRAEWNFLVLPDTGKFASALSMAWTPETGFGRGKWTGYNEALILYIIAAGSESERIKKGYNTWLSFYKWIEPYPGLAHTIFPPLFGHQYSQMFVNFKGIADKYMKEKGIDYFENSRRATLVQQKYAVDNPSKWVGYDSLVWGLTACDGPGSSYNKDGMEFNSYNARGTSGPNYVENDDGTIAPTAAGGSIVFAPEIVIPTLKEMYKDYGDKGLWGKYGFVDAFNPTINWYDKDYLGIDEGPIAIMIENYRNGFVWKYMMKDPTIQKGLKILGFEKLN